MRKVLLRNIKRFLKCMGILLLILLITFGIYISDYYPAEKGVSQYLTGNEKEMKQNKQQETLKVEVKEEKADRYIAFVPEGEISTGLIFYPGAKVEEKSYAHLMYQLAEHGVLCVLNHAPGNIAFLDINAADGIPQQWPEVKSWYLAGHSLGGVVAEMYLSKNIEEYSGIIFLASYGTKDIHESNLRVLSIYGDKDGVLNLEKLKENADNLPSDYTVRIIEGGNHAYFGHYGEQKGDGQAEIEAENQCQQTLDLIIDWLGLIDRSLKK